MRAAIESRGHALVTGAFSASALDAVVELLSPQFTSCGHNGHVELNRPSRQAPELRRSAVWSACQRLAEEYFGVSCHCLYEHAIQQGPHSDAVTVWHQDQAYLGARLPIPSLNFWIPLHDVDEASGTLCFLPKAMDQLLPHGRQEHGGRMQLAISQLPAFTPVAVEVARGGVSVHNQLTVHAATANRTHRPRQAWILHFSPVSPLSKRLHQATGGLLLRR